MAELVDRSELVEMTARIVSAYLGHNPVPVAEMPRLIKVVGAQIASLGSEVTESEEARPTPAVPIRRSVHGDYIVCVSRMAEG